jgi:hypothetical protein
MLKIQWSRVLPLRISCSGTLECSRLGVAAPVLKLQRARIKTRVFSFFGEFKTF